MGRALRRDWVCRFRSCRRHRRRHRMSWFLEQISIEGFRGINNAGAPLELKFHPDKLNSVFAPNGVGKSSIFEAVTYVLTGAIPKLDALPAAERSASYYLNCFHPAHMGTVSLTLRPA